jgi:predicted small metal-binding protein
LRLAPYDITAMQTGWFRAECLYTEPDGRMCGWHTDHTQYEAAHRSLSVHLRTAHQTQINLPKKINNKEKQDA